jgi:hypothetical protein
MPHQKIAFVLPFVLLHSPNFPQLFIHPDLCGVYYELIHICFTCIILCYRFTVKYRCIFLDPSSYFFLIYDFDLKTIK